MPRVVSATPRITVHLYKTISRKAISGNVAVSSRYEGKDAYIDLTGFLGDGASVVTHKSVREPAGAFSITFADHPHKASLGGGPVISAANIETVYGLVEPMDVVEIRMWSGIGMAPAKYPIKMRGFVSEVQRQQTMTPDGKPMRQVVISGLDYGKIWQIYQIQYLPAYVEGKSLLTSYNMWELFGIGPKAVMPAGEFVKTMVEKIINPHIKGFMPPKSELPTEIKTKDGISVKHGVVSNQYQNEQGSVYDLLKFYGDVGVWNELYTEDREDGVHCVYRPTPALSLDDMDKKEGRKTIQDDAPKPVFVPVPASSIESISTSRSDANVANFFWVNNQKYDLIDDNFRKLMALSASDKTVNSKYPNVDPKYYGIRIMQAETQQGGDEIAFETSGGTASQITKRSGQIEAWIDKRRRLMVEMNKDNVVLERGTARIKGGPMRADGKETMKAGDYATFEIGGLSFAAYVVDITDEFMPFVAYTTTLNYERGEGFAERSTMESGRQSPWLAEQSAGTWSDL